MIVCDEAKFSPTAPPTTGGMEAAGLSAKVCHQSHCRCCLQRISHEIIGGEAGKAPAIDRGGGPKDMMLVVNDFLMVLPVEVRAASARPMLERH